MAIMMFTTMNTKADLVSSNLIAPLSPLQGVNDGNCKLNTYRFKTTFYFLTDKKNIEVEFKGSRKSNFTLFDPNGNELQKEVIRPKESKKITLKTEMSGVYKLVADGWFTLIFPNDIKVVYEMSPTNHGQPISYAGPGYFFVPKGTTSFKMAIGVRLIIKDPNGKIYKYVKEKDPKTVDINVPEACDGKRWEICYPTCGQWYFLDLPPYVSLTPNGYIGPKKYFQK